MVWNNNKLHFSLFWFLYDTRYYILTVPVLSVRYSSLTFAPLRNCVHILGFFLVVIFKRQEMSHKSSFYSQRARERELSMNTHTHTHTFPASHALEPQAGLCLNLLCLYSHAFVKVNSKTKTPHCLVLLCVLF